MDFAAVADFNLANPNLSVGAFFKIKRDNYSGFSSVFLSLIRILCYEVSFPSKVWKSTLYLKFCSIRSSWCFWRKKQKIFGFSIFLSRWKQRILFRPKSVPTLFFWYCKKENLLKGETFTPWSACFLDQRRGTDLCRARLVCLYVDFYQQPVVTMVKSKIHVKCEQFGYEVVGSRTYYLLLDLGAFFL